MLAQSIQLQTAHFFFNHNLLKDSTPKKILPKFSPQRWKNINCTANKQTSYYQPRSWSYEFIESIANQNNHAVEIEEENIKKMEAEVKCMLENEDTEPLVLLELIDDIGRLGIGYRFQEGISRALERISLQYSQLKKEMNKSLYASSLYFRLLRTHGYQVSTDVFESFKMSNGNFSTSLAMDIEGMLSLYEASHLGLDGESALDEAREFAGVFLKDTPAEMDKKIAIRVCHALELPFHHRMQRLEARWNIEMYDKESKANKLLHKLAILDFNMVQSIYQSDLHEVSRWWKNVGLANKLSFARDRLMESFFWVVGMVPQPQHSKCRVGLTKVVKLITVLDDIYDVYGSPEELQKLTDAVDKWDVNAVDHLPHYMKIFFFALYNTVNDLAYDTLKEQDQVIIFHLRKGWADLCKTFLREAHWRYKKHIPKFDEYLDHGWVSSSGVVLLTHAFFFMTQNITNEAIKGLNDPNGLLRFPCTIFRLANDLSSSKDDIERGELAKAVSCYMHETGLSDEVARDYIRKLIDQNWKMMNKEIAYNSLFDKPFIETASNLARIALCQYQHGDAHTTPSDVSKSRIKFVIVEPVPF